MKDMQKMNKKTGVLLGISVGAAALIAAACSSEPNNNNTPITPTASTTTTTTAPVPPAPVTPTTSNTVTPPTPPTGSTTNTTTTAPVAEMSTCTETDYSLGNIGNENAAFSGVRSMYVYGDEKTTACTDDTTTVGTVCMEGNAVDSDGGDTTVTTDDYTYWGAGIGLQMAETDDTATVLAPWDAAALGITQLRFTVSNLAASRPLRVQISQVDDPAITDAAKNYQANGFLWGASSPKPAKAGVNTIALTDFKLPSWAQDTIEGGLGAALPEGGDVLNPAKIHSLQFQIANNPKDDVEKYSFCLAQVEWLDAAGTVVAVTVVETGGTGGDTGSDTGAASGSDTSAPAGSGSAGSDTSAPASSGDETSAPAALNFQTDIQPIFTAKCGSANAGCHMNARGGFPSLVSMEPNAGAAAEIKTNISPGAAEPMPPQGNPALTDDEKALLIQWADSK